MLGQAPSGTGKTGAFAIGLLQRMDMRRGGSETQGLVLSPTRELAEQTYDVISDIGQYTADGQPFVAMFVGGQRVEDNVKRIKQGGVVVGVGTPGRIADLVRRGALRAGGIKCVVLDEADELLSQGFAGQLHEIFRFMPRDVQIVLFSATMPPEILSLTDRLMRSPTRVLMEPEQLTLRGIKQFFVAVTEEEKLGAILDLYETISIAQAVIFASSRRTVEWLGRQLEERAYTVGTMHADMERLERSNVMQGFKRGSTRVLVSSDLMSRGIDVQHVNIVINYDMPLNVESYLHRIGRSGRYGRKGVAINLVSERDVALLRAVEAHYQTHVDELPQNFTDFLGHGAADE